MRAIGTTRGRRAWLLAVERLADVTSRVAMPTSRFTVMLAMDRRDATDAEICAAAGALIDTGAAYFVCVGSGCEEIEDLIDREAIQREDEGHEVIVTTSHPAEPLDEAIFFFVNCAAAAPAYSMLALVVGNDLLAKQIERALAAYCEA